MKVRIYPSQIKGNAKAPPSKSMSHRAILCAGLCRGNSQIVGLGKSKDISATLGAIGQLCASVTDNSEGVNIFGQGGFRTITRPVNCGESGSTLRFLIPLFSLTQQKIHFVGGGRLFDRPQKIYEQLFLSQGLEFEQTPNDLTITGALRAGHYTIPGDVSSQFISGLLFTLPLLNGTSTLTITGNFESASYVELTLGALEDFGIKIDRPAHGRFEIKGNQRYLPCRYTVEGDYSQAAFLAVLGAVMGGLSISNLRADSKQGDKAILDILKNAGAVFSTNSDTVTFEKSDLTATEIDLADCPDLGPILMVMASLSKGTTVIKNAGRLRIKESDRIFAMEQELRKFGVNITSTNDTVTVTGGNLHAPTSPISAHNDHRIVMSMAVLALATGFETLLEDAQAVAKSWPEFFLCISDLGAKLHVEK